MIIIIPEEQIVSKVSITSDYDLLITHATISAITMMTHRRRETSFFMGKPPFILEAPWRSLHSVCVDINPLRRQS